MDLDPMMSQWARDQLRHLRSTQIEQSVAVDEILAEAKRLGWPHDRLDAIEPGLMFVGASLVSADKDAIVVSCAAGRYRVLRSGTTESA